MSSEIHVYSSVRENRDEALQCRQMHRKRIDKLMLRSGSVLGCPLESVSVVGEKRMQRKLNSIK